MLFLVEQALQDQLCRVVLLAGADFEQQLVDYELKALWPMTECDLTVITNRSGLVVPGSAQVIKSTAESVYALLTDTNFLRAVKSRYVMFLEPGWVPVRMGGIREKLEQGPRFLTIAASSDLYVVRDQHTIEVEPWAVGDSTDTEEYGIFGTFFSTSLLQDVVSELQDLNLEGSEVGKDTLLAASFFWRARRGLRTRSFDMICYNFVLDRQLQMISADRPGYASAVGTMLRSPVEDQDGVPMRSWLRKQLSLLFLTFPHRITIFTRATLCEKLDGLGLRNDFPGFSMECFYFVTQTISGLSSNATSTQSGEDDEKPPSVTILFHGNSLIYTYGIISAIKQGPLVETVFVDTGLEEWQRNVLERIRDVYGNQLKIVTATNASEFEALKIGAEEAANRYVIPMRIEQYFLDEGAVRRMLQSVDIKQAPWIKFRVIDKTVQQNKAEFSMQQREENDEPWALYGSVVTKRLLLKAIEQLVEYDILSAGITHELAICSAIADVMKRKERVAITIPIPLLSQIWELTAAELEAYFTDRLPSANYLLNQLSRIEGGLTPQERLLAFQEYIRFWGERFAWAAKNPDLAEIIQKINADASE